MTTTLSADGSIQIPEAFRKADALKEGQRCEIERVGEGEHRLRVAASRPDDPTPCEESWVKWLFDCPEKGWFQEPDRSQEEMTSLEPSKLFEE